MRYSGEPPEPRPDDDSLTPSEERGPSGEPSGGIYAPPRRRQPRRATDEASGPGIWGRLTGRHRLEQIREERYRPYTYESNAQNLRWTSWAMAAWALVLVWLAVVDYTNSSRYQEWVDRGIESLPPDHNYWSQIENSRLFVQRVGGEEMACAYLGGSDSTDECPDGELPSEEINNFVESNGITCVNFNEDGSECTGVWTSRGIVEFANTEDFDCPDGDASFDFFHRDDTIHPECGDVFDISSEFQQSQDRSRLIWLLVMLMLLVVAFPYLSGIHRASRNLLPLKSEGQRDRPEWAVLHHFLPIVVIGIGTLMLGLGQVFVLVILVVEVYFLLRPGRVVRELFKGSDPGVTTENPQAWKKEGRFHAIAILWWLLWAGSLLFNPILIPRYVGIENLEDAVTVSRLFVVSDLLLIILGIVALLMPRKLHAWQELRFEKVGPITVTPPLPPDPLQEALREQEEKEQREESERRK